MCKKLLFSFRLTIFAALLALQTTVQAYEECDVGELKWFAMDWVPDGYKEANGQELSKIGSYATLYALIGDTFGGGRNTFALPDLRGRLPLGVGKWRQGESYAFGSQGGSETVTLSIKQLPQHTHQYNAHTMKTERVDSFKPGRQEAVAKITSTSGALESTDTTGQGQAFSNLQPSLAMTPVICVQGGLPALSPQKK